MRWLPRGTHQWDRFLKPSELAAGLRPQGIAIRDLHGLSYDPFARRWSLTPDIDINYLLFGVKADPVRPRYQP